MTPPQGDTSSPGARRVRTLDGVFIHNMTFGAGRVEGRYAVFSGLARVLFTN
jgi:hypothetical protein